MNCKLTIAARFSTSFGEAVGQASVSTSYVERENLTASNDWGFNLSRCPLACGDDFPPNAQTDIVARTRR
jgi:hypothetical protein